MAIRSTILIARINRAIETGGAIGDGANLAGLYAEAVNAANVRLDAVVTAIESKQISDAVRVMEDEPRLLDEVGALDFQRLPDWEVVCERNGWTMPPKLDQAQIERVLLLNEDAATTESFLRMYRKAVRANDQRLAVQSLRHLVKADATQNWNGNLAQAEKALQTQMANAFEAARGKDDAEAAERLAREFLGEPWSEPPAGKAAIAIRTYVDGLDAAARDKEGGENVAILQRNLDNAPNGGWNLDVVFSMLQAIDRLVEAGWAIPKDAQGVVDACRRRCGEEMEAKEFEARWHALCGELHTAVQKEDSEAIRNVLSAPEFLDKEPEEELLRAAQLVIEHEEAARRRRMAQITVCVVAGIAALLGVSAWLFKNKLFNDRCEDVAGKLAALEKEANIDRLSAELARLKSDEPEVYADGRVGIYAGKLDKLVADNAARTNEIVSILGELERLMEGEWKDATMSVTGRIERAKALVRPGDVAYNKRLLAIRSSWLDHVDADETSRHEMATKYSEILLTEMRGVTERLNAQLMDNELEAGVKKVEDMLGKWRATYTPDAPELDAAVGEAKVRFAEAQTTQRNFREALARLKGASGAREIVEAREALRGTYGAYGPVAALPALPYSADEAAALLDGATKAMENYAKRFERGIGDAEFKSFIEDSVVGYKDFPAYYSLYGVYATVWYGDVQHPNALLAVARDKPEIGKGVSYKDGQQISGDLISFIPHHEGESSDSMDCPGGKIGRMTVRTENPFGELLAPAVEIRSLVDIGSRSDLTLDIFENEILKLVDTHIGAAKQNAYQLQETSDKNAFVARGSFPAARRVQLVKMYLDWLKDDLKLMPDMPEMAKLFERLTALSQTVKVDGVSDEMTWTCLFDTRVRTRNRECAAFLAKFPADFVARYRKARDARRAMGEIAKMKVESAGKVAFDPSSPAYRKNPKTIFLGGIAPDVTRDHPLYVLRKEGDAFVLKKAFVDSKGKWTLASQAIKDDLLLGEPLFQISFKGAYIDMEAKIVEIFKSIPDNGGRPYLQAVPYFKIRTEGK